MFCKFKALVEREAEEVNSTTARWTGPLCSPWSESSSSPSGIYPAAPPGRDTFTQSSAPPSALPPSQEGQGGTGPGRLCPGECPRGL